MGDTIRSTAAMNEHVLVSVGCAVYNGAETLRRALDPLVQQDHPCVEIIICDDGSTDGSQAICREYAGRHGNIRYIENKVNLGLIANCNNLFHLAKGKYFFWADQDDVRDRTFISKCVAVLESDPGAVMCHSHAGVFWKRFENLMHINTIDSVDQVENVLARYWRFLRRYTDTTIYGLIRVDALRATHLWTSDVGSSNLLLFQLLLMGRFRQVPEALYYYSARGLRNRPTPEQEYLRANAGRRMPRYRKPFIVLALNQTKDILKARLAWWRKCALVACLWGHVVMVNSAKALFRGVAALAGRFTPRWFERWCASVVSDPQDIHFVVPPQEREDYLPKGWPLT